MEAVATGLNWTSSRYLLRELVGSGGMSQVYRAWDRELDREVAVKVLHPHLAASADSRKRFSREARAVAKLRHPHILEIFDFSGDADGAFIVTEFIEGTTLDRFSREVGFGLPQLGALAAHSLCLALEHAHTAGIVHRDIKPENVMVSRQGILKLMDFGIARFLDQGEKMTMTGAMIGSPAYMAPEVIEGKEADGRSDLFSLGTLLYWLLTGVLPFEAANTSAVLKRVLDASFTDPRLLRPAISDSLAAVVASLLSRSPAARPQSAQEVRSALAASLAEDGIADPEAELKAFLASPDAYRARFRAELLTRLRESAQAALREGHFGAALKLADRVLALEPEDRETRAILDQVSARKRRMKRLRQTGTALLSTVAVAGTAFAGHAAWQAWRLREVQEAPAPTAAPPSSSENLAVAPEPSPSAPTPESSSAATQAVTSTEPSKPTELAERTATKPAIAPFHGLRKTLGSLLPKSQAPNANAPLYDQHIVVSPWANVAIDGKKLLNPDGTPLAITATTLQLPFGNHTLAFSAKGWETQNQVVDIQPENRDLRVKLQLRPATLKVNAPSDAMVFIDNVSYGSAARGEFVIPLTNNPEPTVQVEVQRNGYRSYVTRVQLRADETKEITAPLEPSAKTP